MNRLLRFALVATLACTSFGARASGVITAYSYAYGGGVFGDVIKVADSNFPSVSYIGGLETGAFSAGLTGFGAPIDKPFGLVYCVELYQDLDVPGVNTGYSVVSAASYTTPGGLNGWGPNAAAIGARVGKLLYYALPLVNSSVTSGALQLALWEMIYESSGVYSLTSGDFQAANYTPAVFAAAANFLAGAATTTGSYNYSIATSAGFQDVIIIPEPESLALVALALCALVLTRRRSTRN